MSCDGLGVIVRCTPAGGPAGCIVFPFPSSSGRLFSLLNSCWIA